MAMNREQKRAMQRAGQVDAEGSQVTTRERRQPTSRPTSERTGPIQFLREVRGELRKVSWPNRQEVIRYSIIVLVALVIFTAAVFGLDYVFGEFFRALLDPGATDGSAAGAAAIDLVTRI